MSHVKSIVALPSDVPFAIFDTANKDWCGFVDREWIWLPFARRESRERNSSKCDPQR